MLNHVSWPAPGRYILAVSGGADSMVLLDLFARERTSRGYELVVAHFDHGLREQSRLDREFVGAAAHRYGIDFEYHEGRLGKGGEAAARSARHTWLEQVRIRHNAAAVITAHHQDDLIETSLLNLARGSGRLGLAPMRSGSIVRPLLGISRQELRSYAEEHAVSWRDDPTNTDISNPRNYLRHVLLPHASPQWRKSYLDRIARLDKLNKEIDARLAGMLASARRKTAFVFDRRQMQNFSLAEIEELILAAARALSPGVGPDRRIIMEVALFAKTAPSHRRRSLPQNILVTTDSGIVTIQSSNHGQ